MERKHYCTSGRKTLTDFLAAMGDMPLSADDVYTGLVAAGYTGGRSTVYRLLAAEVTAGSVKKFRSGDGSTTWLYQFVGGGDCAHHFHLQCLDCGRVAHLDCDCGKTITAHLLAEHGFTVDCGETVFYGLCETCTAKRGTV